MDPIEFNIIAGTANILLAFPAYTRAHDYHLVILLFVVVVDILTQLSRQDQGLPGFILVDYHRLFCLLNYLSRAIIGFELSWYIYQGLPAPWLNLACTIGSWYLSERIKGSLEWFTLWHCLHQLTLFSLLSQTFGSSRPHWFYVIICEFFAQLIILARYYDSM